MCGETRTLRPFKNLVPLNWETGGWGPGDVDLEDDIEDEGDYAPKLDPRTPVNRPQTGIMSA